MHELNDHIDNQSETFKLNRSHQLKQLKEMQADYALLGCHDEVDVQVDSKKKSYGIRTRLKWLLDDAQPFLEIGALAAKGTDQPLGGGAVAGLGFVSGQLVVVFGNDHQVKGGTLNVYAYKKWARALEIALKHKLPYISLVQSAGYDLDLEKCSKSNGLAMPHFASSGKEFYMMCQLSQQKIPSICLVFGSCTAGGAYQPALSDYTIFVSGEAKVYLAGPPLVKMATGEEKTHEQLGGAQMHASESGLADFLAENDYDACMQCRKLMTQIVPQNKANQSDFQPPQLEHESLLGWIDPALKYSVDMGALLARILDHQTWYAFKPNFGTTLMCGWGSMMGHPVAIIANNGNLTKDASLKGASFIQLANQQNKPIVFIHNNTGFMVGESAERSGIIKAGASFIKAMSTSMVPHVSLIVGASYGAGTYAMCGPGFEPDFSFAWPLSKCNVMGPSQLSGVMAMIKKKQADPENDQVKSLAEKQEQAFTLASELAIDGVIDPRDTRSLLSFLMHVFAQNPIQGNVDIGAVRF